MFPALRIFPTPFNFVLLLQFKVISCAFHKHDKFGHPCYIEHTGRTDITALLKVSLTSLLSPFYIYFLLDYCQLIKRVEAHFWHQSHYHDNIVLSYSFPGAAGAGGGGGVSRRGP